MQAICSRCSLAVQTRTRRRTHAGFTGEILSVFSGFNKLIKVNANSLASNEEPGAGLDGFSSAPESILNSGAGFDRWNLGCDVDGDFPTAIALGSVALVVTLEMTIVRHFGQTTVKDPEGAFLSST